MECAIHPCPSTMPAQRAIWGAWGAGAGVGAPRVRRRDHTLEPVVTGFNAKWPWHGDCFGGERQIEGMVDLGLAGRGRVDIGSSGVDAPKGLCGGEG